MTLKTIAPTVAALTILMTAQAALAQNNNPVEVQATPAAYVENQGTTERINLSGALRMLSQRIPSAACHYIAGVDVEGSRTLLIDSKARFEKIVAALQFGDPKLNIIGEESRARTLKSLQALQAEWAPFSEAIDKVLNGDKGDGTIEFILEHNMTVLESAKILASEISAQYSDPTALTQSSAMVIDIAGRQRMLTQKMSKEACAAWSGHSTHAAADLAETMQTFETSLRALRDGMQAAGIKAPPTAEIAAGLSVVNDHWNAEKDTLAAVAAGKIPDATENERVFKHLNKTLVDMNKVVLMYNEAEKLGL